MPSWKRVIVSGSDASLNTLTVTNGITGSLFGTASYATQALSASFAPSTPAFPFTGSAIITGSLNVIGNTTMTGSLIVSGSTSTNLLVGTNALYVSSSGRVGLGVTSSLAATLHVKGGTFPAQLIGTTTDASWDIAPLNVVAKSAAEGYNYGYSPAINIRRNGNNSYPSINFVQNSPTSFGAIVWQDASYPSYTAATTGTHALIQAYNSSTVGIFSIATNSAIGTTGVATMLHIIGNKMAIGTVTPTSLLHLSAGTAAANTAPLKLTSGTNLTTPEAGAVEFDGSNLFFTTGSTRQIAVAATSALTSSRIPYATTNGRLIDSANLTYGATANTLHVEGGSTNTLFELTRAGEITYKYNINSSNALNITTTTNDTEYYFLRGNKFGIGVSATARLHIVGGTSTANTAPIKLTAGTNLTTPEAGTIEFDGNSLFFTTGSTRSTILTNTNPAGITGNLVVTGSLLVSGSVRLNGNAGVNITGNTQITGSLLLSGSSLVAGITPIPLAGTIKDGVTSVLGSLNDWNSNYYQGDVLYSEIAGGTITFGQLCYRTQNETWELADATAANSAAAFNMLGICVKSSTSTNPTSILINGFVETATYATIVKSGEPLYMATTAGSMTKTAPTTVGNAVRIIGNTFWDSNTNSKIIIRFNPENSWIEL